MKSFQDILSEDLKSEIKEMGPRSTKIMKEAHSELVINLDKLINVLTQLNLNRGIKDFGKELELYEKVKKQVEKSNLGKHLKN